jgi:Na+/H+ antiporter NhaA
MSFDVLGDVNWLAILVGAIAWFIIGALWYGPLFGKAWMASTGIDPRASGERPSAAIYVFPLLAYLVATVALAMLAEATGSSTLGHGIILGVVVGVGFGLTLYAVEAVFGSRPKPGSWFLITGAYQLIGVVVASVIVTVWD